MSTVSTIERESELALGLVAPVGTNLEKHVGVLTDRLGAFGYKTNVVSLSEGIRRLVQTNYISTKLVEKPEYRRVSSYMDGGNDARRESGQGDILALVSVVGLHNARTNGVPMPRTAHIFRSLKTPEEVRTLRAIYGAGFFLIGFASTKAERRQFLKTRKNMRKKLARKLMKRDEAEHVEGGQQTRDTFQMSDVFVRSKKHLWRFLDLLFGSPTETPTRDENAMFLAYSTSLRSADLSRQVGAVITSPTGEVIGTGCNDVPQAGGGLYWCGPDDQRDHIRGHDSNQVERERIMGEIVDAISDQYSLDKAKLTALLNSTGISDITEYGRAVHAEMEAILSCARKGMSTRDATLYSTTFPCHNCAKHIVASGIRQVFYVEPYPKSKAFDLHNDAIAIDRQTKRRVDFRPFVGVGPRRYFDLFSMKLGSGYRLIRKDGAQAVGWERTQESRLRVTMQTTSYLEREKASAGQVTKLLGDASE